MKFVALVFAALVSLAPDVSPRSSSFHPKRLSEERSISAAGLWLIAPGGKFIATAAGGDSVGLIEVATGNDLGVLGEHSGGRHDGNFGQSDRILATTANDGPVKVWDATTRKEIASFKSPHPGYT